MGSGGAPIVVADGAGRAELVDDRWILDTERSHLAQLAEAVTARDGARRRRWVVSDPTEVDAAAAAAAGLAPQRDVLQLRRLLPVEAAVVHAYPRVEGRPFRPGTEDEGAWIACNNRAFAAHSDQGGFTSDRLHRIMGEPWFDPAGFLLHEDGEDLVGFCWTKIHEDTTPVLGEIFAIGVDPTVAGRGLGGALTLAGLDSLASRGVTTGMLYVDADNTAARRLYDRLGFALHHLDRIYESRSTRRRPPPRGR